MLRVCPQMIISQIDSDFNVLKILIIQNKGLIRPREWKCHLFVLQLESSKYRKNVRRSHWLHLFLALNQMIIRLMMITAIISQLWYLYNMNKCKWKEASLSRFLSGKWLCLFFLLWEEVENKKIGNLNVPTEFRYICLTTLTFQHVTPEYLVSPFPLIVN